MGQLNPVRQAFITVLTGSADDLSVEEAVKALKERYRDFCPSKTLKFRGNIANLSPHAKQKLTDMIEWLDEDEVDRPTRLYLMGHGDWKNATLAGHSAKAYSEMFSGIDALRWVTRLRIWGCGCARGRNPAGKVRGMSSVNSFAWDLCFRLKVPTLEIHANYHNQLYDAGRGIKLSRVDKEGAIPVDRMERSIKIFQYLGGAVVEKWKDRPSRISAGDEEWMNAFNDL